MKMARLAAVLLLLSACEKPAELTTSGADRKLATSTEKDQSAASDNWKIVSIVDRLTDEEGIEAKGIVDGAQVAVRCMSGQSLAYVFELADDTDDVGLFGRSAAVQVRLDDKEGERTTVGVDQRFPNQVRIATKDVSRDLDALAEGQAWGWQVSSPLAVRMALADRIRLSIRTNSGEAFIDLIQPAAVRQVQAECGAVGEEFEARLETHLARAKEAEAFTEAKEEFRTQLTGCIEASGLARGSTPEVGFDVRTDGPNNINADFGLDERMGSLLRQCWPQQIPARLLGHRVTMRLPS